MSLNVSLANLHLDGGKNEDKRDRIHESCRKAREARTGVFSQSMASAKSHEEQPIVENLDNTNKNRWCSLCYKQNKDENGIINSTEISNHYETAHISEKDKWPKTEIQKAYLVKFNKQNQPVLYDNISTKLPSENEIDAPVFMIHKKTEQDIIARIDTGQAYAMAWYRKPRKSAEFDHQWALPTLLCDGDFGHQLIKQLISKYPDLKEKIKNEYPHILDDVYNQSPSNLNEMSFKEKAFQIIKELKECLSWIKYFAKPVDEEKDQAPNYYDTIKNPMDLQTLSESKK